MSSKCSGCGHFIGEPHDWCDSNPYGGECSLNPKWIAVMSDHFCGQLHEIYRSSGTPAQRKDSDERQRSAWEECSFQKSRAIAAEKKLKEARAKLRLAGGK